MAWLLGVTTIVFVVLWLCARNDKKHEAARAESWYKAATNCISILTSIQKIAVDLRQGKITSATASAVIIQKASGPFGAN